MLELYTEALTAMFTVLEPEAQGPEVYRNTPFEHLLTADAGQLIVICTMPIPIAQGWIAKAETVQINTPLPGWMASRLKIGRPSPAVVESILEQPAAPFV